MCAWCFLLSLWEFDNPNKIYCWMDFFPMKTSNIMQCYRNEKKNTFAGWPLRITRITHDYTLFQQQISQTTTFRCNHCLYHVPSLAMRHNVHKWIMKTIYSAREKIKQRTSDQSMNDVRIFSQYFFLYFYFKKMWNSQLPFVPKLFVILLHVTRNLKI